MKRIVEMGHFGNCPAILIKNPDDDFDRVFLIDKNSAFAVQKFINAIAQYEYCGTCVDFVYNEDVEHEMQQ